MIRSYGEQVKILADRMESGLTMLYKYCSVATAEKIFNDGAVLLKPAIDFNDPFEMACRIRWPDDDELRRRIYQQFASLSESEKAEVYEDALGHKSKSGNMLPLETRKFLLGHAGVSCFSETRESILMWSHYGDEHKGVCIGFSVLELLQSLQNNPVSPCIGDISLGSVPCVVQYKDALPIWEAGYGETVGDVVATKARCWAYEREWRIFGVNAAGKKQKLLPEAFGQVIFGARAENDKERIICSIAERYPAVKFLKTHVLQEEYKVGFSNHECLRK